jgi:secreted PhoX family phosphatase
MGDDGYFEYLYRYLSREIYVEGEDTSSLLDHGTLSVAKLHDDGTLTWLPLVHGHGPLTKENGFLDQGDVLIEARRAGDLLGATPMDRCEDVEPNPHTGRVYVNCTKNPRRGREGTPSLDAANPRNHNEAGHVIELIPTNGHSADTMSWDILLLAGKDGQYGIAEGSDKLGCPDNACVDPQHRLWISTDGSEDSMGFCDGLYAVETKKPFRGFVRRFFSAPRGAEVTGPCFHPSGKELFLSIQHPGFTSDGAEQSHTSWPDFSKDMPPRPSVVCIRRKDGGVIGG